MKPLLLTLAILHLTLVISAAQTRTALVMGVGDYGGATYKGKAIPNLPGITTADVPHMAEKLKSLGFSVTTVTNPTRSEAITAVDAFSARIKANPGVSLFYFSGHGGEFEGKNYLIPKKASISSKADLADEALSAQRVLNGMEESGAQVNLVFLDCCREDLGKSVSGAEMQPMRAKGSFIGFATRSGDFADPGEEGSPYTRFLLKHLDKPGVSIADMYGFVVKDVKDYSKRILGEERRPGFYSELEGEPFYFVPASFKREKRKDMEAEIERRARELAASMATPAAKPKSEIANSQSSRSVPVSPTAPTGSAGLPKAGMSLPESASPGQVIELKLPGGFVMKFCYCPPGSFTMGSPSSEKGRRANEDQVQVNLTQGFWMAQTECTQDQWQSVMGTSMQEHSKRSDKLTDTGPNFPMGYVSYEDARNFCAKLQGSVTLPSGWQIALPSEAQWEYACRAGTATAFSGNPDKVAWYFSNNGSGTKHKVVHEVAGKQANAWGLYDMRGNVEEWCADWYASKLVGGTDPNGPTKGDLGVHRGGSGLSVTTDDLRAAYRVSCAQDYRSGAIGFRPALVPSRTSRASLITY